MTEPTMPHVDLDQFVRRLLIDCMLEATKEYWLKRARTFEDAQSRVGDYTGLATPEQIQAQDDRLAATAQACRNAASLCHHADFRSIMIAQFAHVLDEVA